MVVVGLDVDSIAGVVEAAVGELLHLVQARAQTLHRRADDVQLTCLQSDAGVAGDATIINRKHALPLGLVDGAVGILFFAPGRSTDDGAADDLDVGAEAVVVAAAGDGDGVAGQGGILHDDQALLLGSDAVAVDQQSAVGGSPLAAHQPDVGIQGQSLGANGVVRDPQTPVEARQLHAAHDDLRTGGLDGGGLVALHPMDDGAVHHGQTAALLHLEGSGVRIGDGDGLAVQIQHHPLALPDGQHLTLTEGDVAAQLDGVGHAQLNGRGQTAEGADAHHAVLALLGGDHQLGLVGGQVHLGSAQTQGRIVGGVQLDLRIAAQVGVDAVSILVHPDGIEAVAPVIHQNVCGNDLPFISVGLGKCHQKFLRCHGSIHGFQDHDLLAVFTVGVFHGCLVIVVFNGPQVFDVGEGLAAARQIHHIRLHIIAQQVVHPMPLQLGGIVYRLSQGQGALAEQIIGIALLTVQIHPLHGLVVADHGGIHIKENALLDLRRHQHLGEADTHGGCAVAGVFDLQIDHTVVAGACGDGLHFTGDHAVEAPGLHLKGQTAGMHDVRVPGCGHGEDHHKGQRNGGQRHSRLDEDALAHPGQNGRRLLPVRRVICFLNLRQRASTPPSAPPEFVRTFRCIHPESFRTEDRPPGPLPAAALLLPAADPIPPGYFRRCP